MNKPGLWLLIAALLGGAAIAWDQMREAPEEGGMSMTPPDTRQMAEGAPIVKVTLPEVLSQDAQIGKRAFDNVCAKCHGENAAGRNGDGPPLIHPFYRPAHHADEAFQRAVQLGVRSHHWTFGDMPPQKGLTRADVKYIIQYVREIQEENGIR